MIWLCLLPGLVIIQYVVLVLLLKKNWKDHSKPETLLPEVSILLAARNEEKDLPDLLRSFDQLDYPAEKLQFLIADDQSTDSTAQIISDWVARGNNRALISIRKDQVGRFQKNGKANALAILSKQATGSFFFFTDADCEVPSGWIREGVSCFEPETGLLIGITQVKGDEFLAKMQELDWWNTLGIVKVVTDLGLPTTGLGNNMVISREAYEACGGFEHIPFSVTEDLEISKSIRAAGYRIHHQVSEKFLNKTKAEKNWTALLRQRKRWMAGAMTLSFSWKVLLSFQFLAFPALLALIALDWKLGVGFWGLKILVQALFLSVFSRKSGQKIDVGPLIAFDFYQIWNLSLTILYYFWPGQIEWKARKYP